MIRCPKVLACLITLFFFCNNCEAAHIYLSGTIVNPTDSLIYFKVNEHQVVLNRPYKEYQAKVDKQGHFTISLPATTILEWAIEYGDNTSLICLQPSDTLVLKFDKFDYYDGYTVDSKHQNEILFMQALNADKMYQLNFGSSFTTDVIAIKDYQTNLRRRIEKSTFKLSFLENYRKSFPIEATFYNWLKTSFTIEPYAKIFLENILIDSSFSERTLIDEFAKIHLNNDTAALSSAEYNDVVDYYSMIKTFGDEISISYISDVFNFAKNNLKGSTRNVLMTSQLVAAGQIDSIYDRLYPQYIEVVTDTSLLTLVAFEKKKSAALKKESMKSLENISASKELKELFEAYKGKVVYIDFWASWCKPCLQEMPKSRVLREKLKDQNIVFLYLGYNDTKTNWLGARKELGIEGEHILLSPTLIQEAKRTFNVTGIPHYAIIDKDGTIIQKNAGRPGYADTESFIRTLLE
jgi:thiol-disulfide isomerase/thioredoxin